MKRCFLLFLCLCLCLMAGCESLLALLPGREAEDTNTINIYRLFTGSEGGALLRAEACLLRDGERAEIARALELFAAASGTAELETALPAGVSVESWSLEGGVAVLTMSESFDGLSEMEKTAAAFAAALTLCGLEEVEAVSLLCGGETLFQGLVPEDALLQDTEADPYTRRLSLYFPDAEGRYLVSESHSLSLDENSSLERYVMEELLRGPNDPSLGSAIPAGTALLSCRTEGGVCTVDLSEEFLLGRPQTALGERLAIYSIVNSLGALSNVKSVRILCEGAPVQTYVFRSLEEPLESWKGAVGPASAVKGEIDAVLYRPLPGLTALAAMPCVVETAGYDSPEEALLAALTQTKEPGYPSVLGPEGILSVEVHGYSCTVDLAESFFAALTVQERAAAVGSLAASLCSLEDIRSVFIRMDGQEAVYEGIDYTGPWNTDNINIVE